MKNSSSLATGLLASLLLFISSNSRAQFSKLKPELENNFASTINTPANCEAYPYLSDDGLRLYFTSDRGGGFGMLYYCSRSTVNENFNKPKPLSQSLSDGFYAATFTADELTIYASKEGGIYTAKRNSLKDEFKNPVIVTGLAEGRKFAPSISSDGNELIVILDISEKDIAVHYRKNAAGDFIEVNRLGAPGKTDLDPGQFSKDGFSFYTSYDVKIVNEKKQNVDLDRKVQQKIVRFTRRSLSENFKTIEEVPDELNFQMRNHQPTMNKDETIFVVVNAEEDSWGKNELRLVNFDKVCKQEIEMPADTLELIDKAIICYIIEPEEIPALRKKIVDSFLNSQADSIKLHGITFFRPEQLAAENLIIDKIPPPPPMQTCECIMEEISETDLVLEIPEIISQVKVYPNPFTDDIIVTLEKNGINSNFELFDIAGRKIMTSKLNNSVNRIQFNKPGAGIYIYRLTNSKGKVFATGKLVRK